MENEFVRKTDIKWGEKKYKHEYNVIRLLIFNMTFKNGNIFSPYPNTPILLFILYVVMSDSHCQNC